MKPEPKQPLITETMPEPKAPQLADQTVDKKPLTVSTIAQTILKRNEESEVAEETSSTEKRGPGRPKKST